MSGGNPNIIGIHTEPPDDGFGPKAIEWHVASVIGGDYATACGLDGNDSMSDQHGTVEPGRGQQVTCPQCYALWRGFRSLKLRDAHFGPGARR